MDRIAFSHATATALASKTSFNAEHISSFSSGGSFGWITNGNQLEVFSTNNGSRLSSWIFGMDGKKKYNTIITAVCECPQSPFLVVGTVTDDPYTPGSLVCLFNARTSQVTKVITVPYEVTSLEYVCGRSNKQPDLCKRMDNFDGIVAMGTYNGHIYLLDLKLSQHSQTSEKCPGSIIKDDKVSRLLQNEQHTVVWLGDATKGEKSRASGQTNLYISSLKFLKKTSLLAVGLSSGVMELWDLKTLELLFSNFVGEPRKGIMINNFVFQEPENDPKNVCYLWVFYMPSQGSPKSIGQAFLLQMIFQDRSYDSVEGYTYNKFLSAFLRFSHPLCSSLDARFMAPSKLLSCASLSSGVHDCADASEDDYCQVEDLMAVVWQETKENGVPQLYLLSFDLNQWYHCQMPSSTDSDHYISMVDMLAVHGLEELEKQKDVVYVKVDAAISADNHNITGVLPLIDFGLTAITPSGLVFENIMNTATQMSREIEQCQHVLFDKTSYYEMCYRLRELCNVDSSPMSITETSEHFSLLSTIMDHGAVGVLVSIVRQLACARFSGVESFLTLEHVVEWSRHKLLSSKNKFNKLIVLLLEHGPAQIDSQSLHCFNKCKKIVHQLVVVLSEMVASPDAVLDEAKPHLFTYLSLAMHIEKFMCAATWFLNADPMCFCHGALIGGSLSSEVVEQYTSRRLETLGRKLVIDFIVSGEGQLIKNHFKQFSNSPDYPPSNLETLLGIYLLPGVNMRSKHFISLYFLEDLLQGASETTRSDMLSTFASQLKIPQSFAELVRASWCLDHQRFKESYKILHHLPKDGSVDPHFYPNIVKGFLEGKEVEFAIQASRKFLLPIEDEEGCCVFLEALAVNGKIGEAYQSLKHHAPNYTDCFAKVMAKYGKGEFLKEVLKTPMLANERCQTYFDTFKSAALAPVNVELFNESNLKIKTTKVYQRFKYRQLQMAVEKREAYLKESIEASAKSSEKKTSKKDGHSNLAPSKLTCLNVKTESEDVIDETFLHPRNFEAEDMKFFEIPVPKKLLLSPKGAIVHHHSILSKPRSISSHSGDSAVSSKQIRFAEPEKNTLHFIGNASGHLSKENEIDPTIEEGLDEGGDDNSEETLQEESCNDNVETLSTDSVKASEEIQAEEVIEKAVCADYEAERNFIQGQAVVERHEFEMSETFGQESLEVTVPSREHQNVAQDFDQVSVCTNEISEAESLQASEADETLKRPPLRKSKRSLAPEAPTRRSSRLTSIANGVPPQQEPQERPTKRIKFEDANADSFIANSRRETRSRDTKENDSQLVVCPPVAEGGRKTPVKVQQSIKCDTPSGRKSTRTKRSRTEEEDDEPKTPGKRKRLDENSCKTPTKSEPIENPVVTKTPRRTRKNSANEEVAEVQEKRKSPSRRKKDDLNTTSTTITTTATASAKEEGVEEIEKVELKVRTLDNEGPLTPAQKAIRMRRILREQEVVKMASKPSKSKDPVEKQESVDPTDPSLPVLRFSDPITSDSPHKDIQESDSTKKSNYVFSPPLTRLRQRRKEGEETKSEERTSTRKK